MKNRLKVLLKRSEMWAYHLKHKKQATGILRSLESAKGRTDKKLIKLSDEYAADVFGWKGYAPWLYVYSAMNQTFKGGWIPDNYYGSVVVPKLKGDYGKIADYNALTGRLFNSSVFPVRAYFANGLWISRDYQILTDRDISELSSLESRKLVFKTDNSVQGRGIHFIEDGKVDAQKLKWFGNGVLQTYINQHSFFDDILSNSVATLRLTSVIDDEGLASVRACYLRVGRSSDTHVRSVSHVRIPVDIHTGFLNKFGYTTDWMQTEKHPDTGFIFERKQIPSLNKCIETVRGLHNMVPFTRTIGWDVILDADNNVQVMEWNGSHNDIKFSEATVGPCFADLGWEDLWKD